MDCGGIDNSPTTFLNPCLPPTLPPTPTSGTSVRADLDVQGLHQDATAAGGAGAGRGERRKAPPVPSGAAIRERRPRKPPSTGEPPGTHSEACLPLPVRYALDDTPLSTRVAWVHAMPLTCHRGAGLVANCPQQWPSLAPTVSKAIKSVERTGAHVDIESGRA